MEWRVRIAFVMAVHTWRFVSAVTVGNYHRLFTVTCHSQMAAL